jgi:hypothetical protein
MNPAHTSHPISLWSILILSYHLPLDLLSGLFSWSFPTKVSYVFFISMCATCSAHLDFINLTILSDTYKLWSSCITFHRKLFFFAARIWQPLAQPRTWMTTTCRLSTTANGWPVKIRELTQDTFTFGLKWPVAVCIQVSSLCWAVSRVLKTELLY